MASRRRKKKVNVKHLVWSMVLPIVAGSLGTSLVDLFSKVPTAQVNTAFAVGQFIYGTPLLYFFHKKQLKTLFKGLLIGLISFAVIALLLADLNNY